MPINVTCHSNETLRSGGASWDAEVGSCLLTSSGSGDKNPPYPPMH